MNLTDTKLRAFAWAMVIFVFFNVLLNFFIFKLLTETAKPLRQMHCESGEIKVPGNLRVQEIKDTRNAGKRFLLWDSFVFVPLYFVFLIVMSFLLRANSASWAANAANILIAVTIIATASDLIENYYTYLKYDCKIESNRLIYWAEHIKWLTIFLATGIASFIFLRFDRWGIAGALMLTTSIIGIGIVAVSSSGSNKINQSLSAICFALLGIQLLTLLIVGACLLMITSCRANFLDGY